MSPLADNKKLTVVYRVEPGCLGPTGRGNIEAFCDYANKELAPTDSDFVNWDIMPRYDKSLPEMQYLIANKKLDTEKTEKYLGMLGRNLDEFESNLHEKLSVLIEQYLGRPA